MDGGYLASHFEEVQEFKNLPIELLTGLVTEKEVSEHREHQGKIGETPFLAKSPDVVEISLFDLQNRNADPA